MNSQNVLWNDVLDLLYFREKFLEEITDFSTFHFSCGNLKAITDSEKFFVTSAVEWMLEHPGKENEIILTAEKIFIRRFICKRKYPIRLLFKEYIKAVKLDTTSCTYIDGKPRDHFLKEGEDFSEYFKTLDYLKTLLGTILVFNMNKSILMSILITYIFF